MKTKKDIKFPQDEATSPISEETNQKFLPGGPAGAGVRRTHPIRDGSVDEYVFDNSTCTCNLHLSPMAESAPPMLHGARRQERKLTRRNFLKTAGAAAAMVVLAKCGSKAAREAFLQKNFRSLSKEEIEQVIKRLEAEYLEKYGKKFTVSAKGPIDGTLFAYALDISRCIGCRRCVYACVEENNLSRDPQTHWIQVLEMEDEKGIDFVHSNLYYDHDEVPQEGHFYLPVACQQCKNPPCVKSCPVGATWMEPDGIVVVDYNWCIGCRCCMAACPYGALTKTGDRRNIIMHLFSWI
jgi:Fe-S-cluster-containing hydrogenase component 2